MGTFMNSSKRIIVKNANPSLVAQLDVATTFQFHIYERNQDTVLSTIEVQVSKLSGRTSTILTAWFDVPVVGGVNDLYTFDYTVTGVAATDQLLFMFKVVDADGIESFISVNDIQITS